MPHPARPAEANPSFGYRELRRGRVSSPGSDFFLTLCLRRPASGLSSPKISGELFALLDQLEAEGCCRLRTAVVMPDHLHLVVTLGATELSAAMRLFKGRAAEFLRVHGLRWQPSFFDHRFRSTEESAPIFRYVLLNPYRRGLIPFTERWPAYRCAAADWQWFGPTTNDGRPWPEWLRATDPRRPS